MIENSAVTTSRHRDAASAYEYLVMTVRPEQTIAEARRELTDHAEYGHWELRRSRTYVGGMRRFWLRRRVMRVPRTLPPSRGETNA